MCTRNVQKETTKNPINWQITDYFQKKLDAFVQVFYKFVQVWYTGVHPWISTDKTASSFRLVQSLS